MLQSIVVSRQQHFQKAETYCCSSSVSVYRRFTGKGKRRPLPASPSPTHQPHSLLGSSPPTASLVNFNPEPKSLTGKFLFILNKMLSKKNSSVVIQQRSLAEVTFSDPQRGRSEQKWKTPTLLQLPFLAINVSFLCWGKRNDQVKGQLITCLLKGGGCGVGSGLMCLILNLDAGGHPGGRMLSGLEGFPTANGRGRLTPGPLGMWHIHSITCCIKVARWRRERGNAAIDP